MKVKCPKCGTHYKIADSKIPEKGAHARCSRCQARFFLKKTPHTATYPKKRQDNRVCKNCDRKIGYLEKLHLYNGNMVCHECHERLNPPEKTYSIPQSHAESTDDLPASPDMAKKSKAKSAKNHTVRSLLRPSTGRLNFLLDVFSKDLAMDLGTANTLIYIKGRGIVLNEPSVVALRMNARMEKRVLAVGAEAKEMLGKVPMNISAIRPMRGGVIADFEVTEIMLKHFIKKVRNGVSFFRPRIIIAVPFGITPVEKRAVREAAGQAGARKVFLIEEPMAAAIGAGLSVTQPTCSMVVDIGGGTTEVAVISLAGIVSSRSLRVAGDRMDDAIIRYVKNKYNFLIGERTAEMIKITIGNAWPDAEAVETMEIKGWDLVSGKPRVLLVDSQEIQEAILEHVHAIIDAVKFVLDRTPQELTADVVKGGIVLTGGVALLKNLDKFVGKETGLPIRVAENPLLTVALGSGKTLDNADILRQIMIA